MSQEETLTEAQKQEAKAKLKERFGATTRTGGKGNVIWVISGIGTERRKKKVVKTGKQEDKKIVAAVKKYSPQPLDGIIEVNMFKDDNTVIHFTKPSGMSYTGNHQPYSPVRSQGELPAGLRDWRN